MRGIRAGSCVCAGPSRQDDANCALFAGTFGLQCSCLFVRASFFAFNPSPHCHVRLVPSSTCGCKIKFPPSEPLQQNFRQIWPKTHVYSSTRLLHSYTHFYCASCPSSITAVERFSYWVEIPHSCTSIASTLRENGARAAVGKEAIDETTSWIAPTLCYTDAVTTRSTSVCTTVLNVLRVLFVNQGPRNF